MDGVKLPYTGEDGIQQFEVNFSSQAHVEFLSGVFPVPLTTAQISNRLAHTIEAYLQTQSVQRNRSLIVVEDDTRPSRLAPILEPVLDNLRVQGWGPKEITFLVASGAHGPSRQSALRWKLGERILANYTVVQHQTVDCLPTGIPFLDGELKLNRLFLDADWVILVGTCLPHPFAGFGGGMKMIVPGIASLETIIASHKLALLGGRPGALDKDVPPYRELIHTLVNNLRPSLSIVCLINYAGETVELCVGNPLESYYQAVMAAKSIYGLSGPTQPCDVLLLNCYPKDRDLIQCKNSLTFHRRHGTSWLKDDGLVILTAPGVRRGGIHHVLGPGGRLYQRPGKIKSLSSHRLWFYAPQLPRAEYGVIFSQEYPLFESWPEVAERLAVEFPHGYSVGVVPAAALHL